MNTRVPPSDPMHPTMETSTPVNPSQARFASIQEDPAYSAPSSNTLRITENSSPIALNSGPGWTSVATAYESACPGGSTVKRTGGPAHNPDFYTVSEFSERMPAQVATIKRPEKTSPSKSDEASSGAGHVRTGRSVQDYFWDPRTPYILSLYLQLFFNIVIVSSVLVLLYKFVTTVRADVHGKMETYTSDAVREISRCSREYFRNKCSSVNRAPALEQTCMVWEKCMNRDPQQLGRSQITAETFAQIVDGFLRPISWKALVFFTLLTLGALVATNIGFGSYRKYARDDNGRVAWLEEQLHTMQEELLSREQTRDPQISREHVLAASTPFQQPTARFLNSSMFANESPLSGKERRM